MEEKEVMMMEFFGLYFAVVAVFAALAAAAVSSLPSPHSQTRREQLSFWQC